MYFQCNRSKKRNGIVSYFAKQGGAKEEVESADTRSTVDLVTSSDEETEKEKKKKVVSSPSNGSPIILEYLCCDSRSVTLTANDVARLTDGRMLNDSLINFYLKYLSDKFRSIIPTVTSRVFIFSTFFYTKLTEVGFKFDNVKRWTKKSNIFKDFNLIFVPIHEAGHWSLALIWCMGTGYRVLHLDALRMHDHNRIGRNIVRYLRNEWLRLKKNGHFKDQNTFPASLKEGKVDSVSVPRQRNGYDCGMFVCAYSEKIFEELQEKFHSKLDPDLLFDGKQKKDISRTFFVVLKSLWEQEKTRWFTSQHVTNMRSILKNEIRAMSKAQREKESSHHEASVETTNKTITTASKTITTTSTTITTTSTTMKKKRQKRIESDSEDEEKILVSETSKKKFSVPDENFGLKKKTISTTTKKRENQIEIGTYTLLDNDHDDSSENEDLAVEFMSSRKVAKKDSSEKSMKEIERGEIGMSSIPKDESLSRLSLKKTSSVDYDFSKDESPREIENSNSIVDDDFPKNESPRQHDKRKSRDFMKDKIEDKKHQTNRPRDVKRSEDDGEEIVIIDDSESEMTQEEPSLQQHSFEYVKRDSLQSKFSSLPEVNSPTNASLEEFWKDVEF